jgi:hypothetical protein
VERSFIRLVSVSDSIKSSINRLIKEIPANFDIYVPEVQVTGTGSSTPPGQKFPGAYNWRDPGILYNTKYGPNKYVGFAHL